MSSAFYRQDIKCLPAAGVLSGAEISSNQFEDFSVSVAEKDDTRELKRIEKRERQRCNMEEIHNDSSENDDGVVEALKQKGQSEGTLVEARGRQNDINPDPNPVISVEVSGNKTQRIFDDVFKRMVAAAQPIPGFRRVKGGGIPKHILLEVLGPSKVFKEVIKKIINSTVAEYVEKERLTVSKDLRVQQSFEDLESTFVEGEKFSFDVVLKLKN
ncbi:hypothetical protein V8G54_026909 [Vigna mungo]|uniref:peptidylprolyl isomerase n=1 Tax=Vigna mungo TaxID=3915 RepID=A0AAQ3MZK8_VIGMU